MNIKHLLLILLSCLGLMACDSDDNEPTKDYYVRYTVEADSEKECLIQLRDRDNSIAVIQKKLSDGKYVAAVGPVKTGFKADLTVTYTSGGTPDYLSIEVAEGSSHYVLKEKCTNCFNLEYIIE